MLAALMVLSGVASVADDSPPPPGKDRNDEEPVFTPGQETRVDMEKVGGHFVVYVPSDYDPDTKWPIIFCYHGLNGQPNTSPFRQVTGGKGFIIIGMEYLERGQKKLRWSEYRQYVMRELGSIKTVDRYVNKRLSVNPKLRYIGGFSKGGWQASAYGDHSAGQWAGIAIIGAGRAWRDKPLPNPRAMRGQAVYIGAGEKEDNIVHARKAADFYRKHRADVTFEQYDGLGHQAKPDSTVLRDWLWLNGPLRGVKKELAKARKFEKSRRPGRAYVIYQKIAALSDTAGPCVDAADRARTIADQAVDQLAHVDELIETGEKAKALRELRRLAALYAQSPFANLIKAQQQSLRPKPADSQP